MRGTLLLTCLAACMPDPWEQTQERWRRESAIGAEHAKEGPVPGQYKKDDGWKWDAQCAAAHFSGDPVAIHRCESRRAAERGEPPPRLQQTTCKRQRDGSMNCWTLEH